MSRQGSAAAESYRFPNHQRQDELGRLTLVFLRMHLLDFLPLTMSTVAKTTKQTSYVTERKT